MNAKEPRTQVIKSLWMGNIPLREAFWLYGVIGPALAVFLVFQVTKFIFSYLNASAIAIFLALFMYTIAFYFYYFVACIGIWRSTKQYTGPKLLSVLAKLAILLFVLYNAVSLIVVIFYFFLKSYSSPF